jgi:serine/threonine protein kinase
MVKKIKIFESASDTYTVFQVIGEGGAGRVYSVRDTAGNELALKFLSPDRITTERLKRFKNELDFCRKQKHRNILSIIDSGFVIVKKIKCPFYVMPRFPATLRVLMEKSIPKERILPLYGQLLDGVEAAHLLGVIHRDLKPENVLYRTSDDTVVVADFGIARFEEDVIATEVVTKPTSKMANIRYSAPEQRVKGASVDKRADIYALGLILNEMFTQEVPQGAGYKTVEGVTPDYAYLDVLIEKMIQQGPEARPSTIDDIKKELIAKENEFIARQKLDEKQKEVVSAVDPGKVQPVNLISADYHNGNLVLQLSRVPEPGWMQRFQNPRESYNFIYGKEPSAFQFGGTTAVIAAREIDAQQLINNFKYYSEMATRGYQVDLSEQAAKDEAERRRKYERELAEAEMRERILKNIKI